MLAKMEYGKKDDLPEEGQWEGERALLAKMEFGKRKNNEQGGETDINALQIHTR